MTTETNETHPRNGAINAGLTTGIIGTALGALNTIGGGAALLGGMNGTGAARGGCPAPELVTKAEFELNSKLMAKDAEIADLKSQNYTDQKLVEVYKDLQR